MFGTSRQFLSAALLALALGLADGGLRHAAAQDAGVDAVDPQQAATENVLQQLRRDQAAEADAADLSAPVAPEQPVATPAGALPPAVQGPLAVLPADAVLTVTDGATASPGGASSEVDRTRLNADGILADPQDTQDGRVQAEGTLRDITPDEVQDGDISADGLGVAPRGAEAGDGDLADGASPAADDPAAGTIEDAPEDGEAVVADPTALPATQPPIAFRPSTAATAGDLPDDAAADTERPYDAIGYKLGAFRLFPSLIADETFDNNIFRVGNGASSDWFLTLRPSLALRSQWSRHSLEVALDGTQNWHRRFQREDAKTFDAAVRGRLDVTSRARLDGDLGYSFASQQERGGIDTPGAVTADSAIITRRAGGAYEQRFNRLIARLSGSTAFTEEGVAAATVSNPALCSVPNPPPECLAEQQAFADRRLSLRLGYEVSGGFDVFLEGERNDRGYSGDENAATRRDSDGFTIKLGASADFGRPLRGSLALGYAEQSPADATLATLHGAIVEADVTWTPSALTTVTLTARNGITTTALDGSIGALENAGSIAVRHEFRRWLAGLASVAYSRRDYAGIDLTEAELTTSLGLEYAIDRRWALLADYAHVNFESSAADRDYSVDTVRLGLRVRR